MGVEERGKVIYKDVLPFAGMVMVELMLVGGNTLFKSAASLQGINSYVFTFYVFLIGFIFLLPCLFILHRTSIPPIKISIIGKIFMLSVLMYLSQIFGYVGLKYASPTLSSIMSNLSPAFTFVLAFFFRMEKVHLRSYTSLAKILGTLLSISGAIIATVYSGQMLLSTSMNKDWIIGGILLAGQYFLLSFALVAQAKILVEYSVELILVFVLGISGLVVAGLAALIMAHDLEAWKLRPDVVLATILYMGFSSGFFNVVVQIWVLRLKGPVYVAMFKPLTIIIAVLMGVLLLGDSLYLGSVLGGSIITIGFYGVVWGKAKEDFEGAFSTQTTSTPLLEPHDALEQGETFGDPTLYRSLVGALQYLTIIRPDIAYAVNQVSQFLQNPTTDHFQHVKRILRYVKGTIDFGITFRRATSSNILGYSVADWARCIETHRSTYGYSILLGGNLVSWSAKKQPSVARSSCESEYRAMTNTAAEIVWVTHLLRELHALPPDRPTILCDNQSAIFLSHNPIAHKRAKHIDID
ncbi:WAT1-related protein At4g15540 isoform X2 [Helianthus annuus]|uniref:WAT1-related protein At4g15540 isoform X2 n=1 Tax=Helianthus annuus TaxID=4232 RepID=UPI001652FBE3|nr:WAT1-related protein At4g15540 isoform X2 [Helianthus annuus]